MFAVVGIPAQWSIGLLESICTPCSAHNNHYTSSHNFVPGNTKVPYSPEWLLFTIRLLVVRQTIDRWYKDVKTIGEALVLGILFALRRA